MKIRVVLVKTQMIRAMAMGQSRAMLPVTAPRVVHAMTMAGRPTPSITGVGRRAARSSA
jgi:hypothetical protein